MTQIKNLKIAVVHDAFLVRGGAERLAYYLSTVFPTAPIFTSIYNPITTFQELKQKKIYTHKFNDLIKNEKVFKQFYPLWFGYFYRTKLSEFDVVLSSSTYLAKYISPPDSCRHICYMHSPFRLLWKRESYTDSSLPFRKPVMKIIDYSIPKLQKLDYKLTQRIDQIITNSKNMANFINEIYQKEANIIYPPVDLEQYFIKEPQNYYLCVGRLLSYKKIDIAIKACNFLNKNLIIIGEGFEREKLKNISGPNIHFTGKVNEATLKNYYATCRALIFPGIEDFGMVPIEVQASGRPVIAFKAGGALETVVENHTGVFFDQQNPESLIEAIKKFETMNFSSIKIREQMRKFNLPNFTEQVKNLVMTNTLKNE